MALVFFGGHGLSTDEGNVLAPIDANVDCATGAVRQGITVERFMRATEPAKHKLLILDACRDNPLGLVCPGLKSKKLSFTRIEAGAMQGFLLVTSTQFGQQALDGPPGSHSPFATALLAALEANASVYFEQVMNEVARTTFEAARRRDGFLQIPGKVVGGVAPADCLAGQGCIGNSRMAALAIENERLSAAAVEARTEASVRPARPRSTGSWQNPAAAAIPWPDSRDQDGQRRRPHHNDRILRDVGGALLCSPQEHDARA